MKAHHYYMMPHIPLLLVIVGTGGYRLSRGRRGAMLLAVMLVLMPAIAMLRILPARWLNPNKLVPAELYAEDSRARLRAAVPDKAYCLVGPDDSGSIFFYYLHKKGGGFGSSRKLTDPCRSPGHTHTNLEEYLAQGAAFLYYRSVDPDNNLKTNPEKIPGVREHLGDLLLREGDFRVYRLLK